LQNCAIAQARSPGGFRLIVEAMVRLRSRSCTAPSPHSRVPRIRCSAAAWPLAARQMSGGTQHISSDSDGDRKLSVRKTFSHAKATCDGCISAPSNEIPRLSSRSNWQQMPSRLVTSPPSETAPDLADFHQRQGHAPRFAGKGQGNCTWSMPDGTIRRSFRGYTISSRTSFFGSHCDRRHN
jgi:hypothetical protein